MDVFRRKRSLFGTSRGFTLVELLVSLAIFMIVSLGALPLMITNMHLNQRNQIRNQATAVTGRWIDWLHSQDHRPTGAAPLSVTDVNSTTDPLDSRFNYAIDCSQITVNRRFDCAVSVTWNYRGESYSYAATTTIIE